MCYECERPKSRLDIMTAAQQLDNYTAQTALAELERVTQEKGQLASAMADCVADVERLKAEQYQLASAAADWAARNIILKSDLAALVTALDEATWRKKETRFKAMMGSEYYETNEGRDYSRLSPDSRAVAEKWLTKKEEK